MYNTFNFTLCTISAKANSKYVSRDNCDTAMKYIDNPKPLQAFPIPHVGSILCPKLYISLIFRYLAYTKEFLELASVITMGIHVNGVLCGLDVTTLWVT